MICQGERRRASQLGLAFSLVEVMTAMAVVGITGAALFAGMSWCTSTVRNARENLRATQIMNEKMEVIRLLSWDQITTNNVLPDTFTEAYSASTVTNKKGVVVLDGGLTYYGTIDVLPPKDTQLLASYTNDMRVVHVELFWTNQGVSHSRRITSYVSRYGIENYAFN